MRSKADAFDYRYFPEPDLPPLVISKEEISAIGNQLGEEMYAKIKRYRDEYGFNKEYINGLIVHTGVHKLFEKLVAQ